MPEDCDDGRSDEEPCEYEANNSGTPHNRVSGHPLVIVVVLQHFALPALIARAPRCFERSALSAVRRADQV